ncbi:YhdP family protein [Methylosoma difficile]
MALAISLTAVRLSLSSIESYKALLAEEVSEKVGLPVKIGRLSAKMRGFNPELLLKDITFADAADKPVIQLKEIRLGINVWDVLQTRALLPSTWVSLVGVKLTIIRKADGSIGVAGLKASEGDPLWLLQGRQYELLHSEITWLDAKLHARPLTIKPVDMAIFNDGDQHRINMLMRLPETWGKSLRVSMSLNGNFFQPAAVTGRVFVDGDQLNLPQWLASYLPESVKVASGVGSLQAWLKLEASQAVTLKAKVDLQKLKIINKNNVLLPVSSLHTGLQWTHKGHWQRADFKDLQWSDVGQPAQSFQTRFSIGAAQNPQDGRWRQLALVADQLDLQALAAMAQFADGLPEAYQAVLAQAQPTGLLQQVRAFVDAEKAQFAVTGQFNGLAMTATENLPGFSSLSGQLQGTEQAGFIDLAMEKTRLSIPAALPKPLPLEHLKTRLHWRQQTHDWQISTPEMELVLPHLTTQSRFWLHLPKTDKPPFLDFKMQFASDDTGPLRDYLPIKIMKEDDITWFGRAFPSGVVKNGELQFASHLDKFPNKPDEGLFHVQLDVEKLQLIYAPEWPVMTDIVGSVFIDNRILRCELQSANSHGLSLEKSTMVNPNMGISKTITIKGGLHGAITDVFGFLQDSELKDTTAMFVNALTPKGDTHINVDLEIPLGGIGDHRVAVNAQLNGAAFKVKPVDLWLEHIVGELKFTSDAVSSDNIRAKVFGQPTEIKFSTPNPDSILINAKGSAGIEQLQQQFKMPGWELANGELAYQLQLLLPDSAVGETNPTHASVTIESDLQGVDLRLPGDLAKTRTQKTPLWLRIDLDQDQVLPIAVNYDQRLKAAVKLAMPGQTIQSGHILVGKGEARLPEKDGLWIAFNQTPLKMDEWLKPSPNDVEEGNNNAANGKALLPIIKQIHIRSQDVQWQDSSLGRLDMLLQPQGSFWSAQIESAFGSGTAKLPVDFQGSEKVSLNLDMLNLSALKQLQTPNVQANFSSSTSQARFTPANLPLISIKSAQTLWKGLDLGSLSVETERLPDGLAFTQADLMGIRQQLAMTGDWKINNGQSQSQWRGQLQSAKVGQLLKDLGITKDVAETSGKLDFAFNWAAAPHEFAVKKLMGQIDVQLKEGRLLSVEPGFGRILGILALEQWTKRLQLDFSDVFGEGLTFNVISGHFDMVKGKAYSNNLQVDAVPAKITLKGDTDFGKRIMDYQVEVVPKSADALPIAGTIMGKVTSILARTLTGKNQEGWFFGSHYEVKGKWDNLVVIPEHENDGLLQKTWSGITTFPWLGEANKK